MVTSSFLFGISAVVQVSPGKESQIAKYNFFYNGFLLPREGASAFSNLSDFLDPLFFSSFK